MIRALIVVIILGLCIVHNDAGFLNPKKWVYLVHCKSKDDDLGYPIVPPKGSFNFTFNSRVFGITLFWCHMWQGPNFKHHQVFEGYNGKYHIYHQMIWEAREDGIYYSENWKTYKLKYLWDAPHKLSEHSSD
ncbi:PREDICTED: uncharacterized protein LOC104816678 [Tarenaya hassleriana]|uniref:uncharacterized protein LOC104816678 n=1 Tax=Tarenaya hassleriana TaxID=28532 RepID=UPI00053C982B|nr:PREDICTED: uncharacterized protein LOC104816678 [Tarenaya hassleriana]